MFLRLGIRGMMALFWVAAAIWFFAWSPRFALDSRAAGLLALLLALWNLVRLYIDWQTFRRQRNSVHE